MDLQNIQSEPSSSIAFYEKVKARVIESRHGFDLKAKALYLAQKSPEQRTQIVKAADHALLGNLVLPGTGGNYLNVGNPPQWSMNPTNDREYTFSLNRMFHWRTLLQAYLMTSDPQYVEKVMDELADWIVNCPCSTIRLDVEAVTQNFDSCTPWRSLEVGIRMYQTWNWVFYISMTFGFMSPQLLEKFAMSVYEHGTVLRNVCPILWPNADHNHYVMENLGLLSTATMFPEFNSSQEWIHHAMHELGRSAFVQLTPEGGQIEGSPGYHHVTVRDFMKAITIARDCGHEFDDTFLERIKQSMAYGLHTCRPTGTIVPWGDSDAESVFIRSVMYAWQVFGDESYLRALKGMIGPEAIRERCFPYFWEIVDFAGFYAAIDQVEGVSEYPLMSWQKELSQVSLRSDWSGQALSLFFACRTPVNNGHAHVDPMSFDFTAFGKPLVVDPGRFTYQEGADRRQFKSAAWHNTLTINGREPFEYISTWAFGPQKQGHITQVYEAKDFMAVEAEHANYEPILHKRLCAMIENQFVLILDKIVHVQAEDEIQLYYHLDATDVCWNDETKQAHTIQKDANILLTTTDQLTGELLEGQISDRYDVRRPSTRIKLTDRLSISGSRSYATLLIPYRNVSEIPCIEGLQLDMSDEILHCQFQLNETPYVFKWGKGYCSLDS